MLSVAKYCLKRFFQSLITIIVVVSIVFLLLRLMRISSYFQPGTLEKLSWEGQLNVLRKLGLYNAEGNPINPFVQLFTYYKNFIVNGTLGESTAVYQNLEIWPIIAEKIPLSMQFNLIGISIGLFLGYALGMTMARYKNKLPDSIGMLYIVFVQSVPALVINLTLQFVITKWLNVSMIYREDNPMTMLTPIICVSIVPIATQALWMRRYMVDEINKDYVKLAQAMGTPQRTLMLRHVLRNSFVPLAYNLPMSVVFTLSGSLVMETQFSIPGMGRLLIEAIRKRDNNLVQTLVMLYAAMGIFSVFLGDLLALAVDPRLSLQSKGGTRR
jgi:oligopeptide transport system permease protein